MEQLITEIRSYCDKVGMRTTTFGLYAVGDGKFVDRLSAGGRCWPETVERVRAYIAENQPKPPAAAQQ